MMRDAIFSDLPDSILVGGQKAGKVEGVFGIPCLRKFQVAVRSSGAVSPHIDSRLNTICIRYHHILALEQTEASCKA